MYADSCLISVHVYMSYCGWIDGDREQGPGFHLPQAACSV